MLKNIQKAIIVFICYLAIQYTFMLSIVNNEFSNIIHNDIPFATRLLEVSNMNNQLGSYWQQMVDASENTVFDDLHDKTVLLCSNLENDIENLKKYTDLKVNHNKDFVAFQTEVNSMANIFSTFTKSIKKFTSKEDLKKNSLEIPSIHKQSKFCDDSIAKVTIQYKLIMKESAKEIEKKWSNEFYIEIFFMVTTVLASIFLAIFLVKKIKSKISLLEKTIQQANIEVSSSVQQQYQTILEQASSLQETSSTMEELSISAQKTAKQAQTSLDANLITTKNTQRGEIVVKECLDSIIELKEKVESVVNQNLYLSEQTSQIGSIVNVVSDLANQTNMLALNAAVEAARAGENGKGFAVVAKEIRKLADQSKKSAEQISNIILNIQKATKTAVTVIEEGSQKVAVSTALTYESISLFEGISVNNQEILENMQRIVLNSQQQAQAIQEVVKAISSINMGIQEFKEGAKHIKSNTEVLGEKSTILFKEIIDGN